MKKTGVVPIVSFFPSDLVMVRWVHFYSSRLGVSLTDRSTGGLI